LDGVHSTKGETLREYRDLVIGAVSQGVTAPKAGVIRCLDCWERVALPAILPLRATPLYEVVGRLQDGEGHIASGNAVEVGQLKDVPRKVFEYHRAAQMVKQTSECVSKSLVGDEAEAVTRK